MAAPKGKPSEGMKDRQMPDMPKGMPMSKMPDNMKGQTMTNMDMNEAMAEGQRRNQGGKKKK